MGHVPKNVHPCGVATRGSVSKRNAPPFNSKQPKQVGSKSAVAAFTPVLGASLSSGSDDRPNWRGANIAPSQMDFLDVG